MPTKEPIPPPPPTPTDTPVPPLTQDQQLELAACYAEIRRIEMVVAKIFVQRLMTIWARRSKKAAQLNPPTSPPPPRKKG